MNKKYYCLYENGITIENECELDTLKEVQDFLLSLGNFILELNDYESLIQVGKVEKFINGERFLILIKDKK